MVKITKGYIHDQDFLKKEDILSYLSEEEIFEIVFKEKPEIGKKYLSPFRDDDDEPGCWFFFSSDGKLKFYDFGDTRIINGVIVNGSDCFDAVMLHKNLSSYVETLHYIKNNHIKGKKRAAKSKTRKIFNKLETKIYINCRSFFNIDKEFWKPLCISKSDLIGDGVYPIDKISIDNSKGFNTFNTSPKAYAYTGYPKGRMKIYQPDRPSNKGKFITNCLPEDVGGLQYVDSYDRSKPIVITKSYKDFRVLLNMGLQPIYFQNEGMFPPISVILFIKDFKSLVIWFDNDKAGVLASQKLCVYIKQFINIDINLVYIPQNLLKYGISDPSDYIRNFNRSKLKQLLNEIIP